MGVTPSDPILVAQVSDAAYAQHLGVLWASLAAVHPPGTLRVVLFTDTPGHPAMQALAGFARSLRLEAELRALDMGAVPKGPGYGHIPPIAYARLLLPRLLAAPRAIYLDGDMVVRRSLRPLWEHDLGGAWLGAVPDMGPRIPWRELGLPRVEDYVNSGTLLVDLEAWRRDGVVEACERFLATSAHLVRFVDQDVINAVAQGHIAPLGLEWNWLEHHPAARRVRDPAVVHYVGKVKPWHYRCEHPWKRLYAQFLAQTPWQGYRPPDRTLKRVLARVLLPGPLRRAVRRLDARLRGHA